MSINLNESWICLGEVSQYPIGEKVEKTIDDKRVFIYRNEDVFYAFEENCPHQRRTLKTAVIKGEIIKCIWHEMLFNLDDGSVLDDSNYSGIPPLKVYKTKIENDLLYLEKNGVYQRSKLPKKRHVCKCSCEESE